MEIENKKNHRHRVEKQFILFNIRKQHPIVPVMEGLNTALDSLQQAQRRAQQLARREQDLDLGEIADRIALIVRGQKYLAFELGCMYLMAHELCPVGGFDEWIQALGLHQRSQVFGYIRVYKMCLGKSEHVQNIPNTILLKICAGTFPEDLRDQILNCGLADDSPTVQKVVEAGARVATGEWSMWSPQVRRLLRQTGDQQVRLAGQTVINKLSGHIQEAMRKLERLIESDEEEDPTWAERAIGRIIRGCRQLDDLLKNPGPTDRTSDQSNYQEEEEAQDEEEETPVDDFDDFQEGDMLVVAAEGRILE